MEGHIYIIRNKVNQKIYLGGTTQYEKRKKKHLNDLRKRKHHSILLQKAFNKYSESNFEFVIIENCSNVKEREQYYLDNMLDFRNSYNISKSSTGGDFTFNHPNRDEIIRLSTENLLKAPKPPKAFGDKNPNWRNGSTFCECGARISSCAKTCMKCQDKSGKNNPFYGKNHSKETKKKLRKIAKKRGYIGNQEKVVIIDGLEYKSVSFASKKLGVCAATIVHRIKSPNIKFLDYHYKEKL